MTNIDVKTYLTVCTVCGKYVEPGYNAVIVHGLVVCDKCAKVRRDDYGFPFPIADTGNNNSIDKDRSDDNG